jgi:hypothetical protein
MKLKRKLTHENSLYKLVVKVQIILLIILAIVVLLNL